MKWFCLVAGLWPAALVLAQDVQRNRPSERPVTSREIEQLRRELYQETRSSVEGIFEYRTETGDLNNRLDYLRYGAALNYRSDPSTMLHLRGAMTDYRPLGDISELGGNLTGGLTKTLSDAAKLRLEAGATRFSTDAVTVNALGSLEYNPSANGGLYIRASRANVEETLVSATGVRPVQGPMAGQLIGLVMENRLLGGGRAQFLPRWDVFAEGGVGVRTGRNIESNLFRQGGGGVGYSVIAEPPENTLSLVRASFAVDYFGFDKDLFGFRGVSRVPGRGIGFDGPPVSEAPGRPGTGGYFSPARFVSHTGRIEAKGQPNRQFEYWVSGFAGAQIYTGIQRRAAYGISGSAVIHLNDRFSLPVSYIYDNVGPFRQQTLLFRLAARL